MSARNRGKKAPISDRENPKHTDHPSQLDVELDPLRAVQIQPTNFWRMLFEMADNSGVTPARVLFNAVERYYDERAGKDRRRRSRWSGLSDEEKTRIATEMANKRWGPKKRSALQ